MKRAHVNLNDSLLLEATRRSQSIYQTPPPSAVVGQRTNCENRTCSVAGVLIESGENMLTKWVCVPIRGK